MEDKGTVALSRRRFLGWSQGALAALGVSSFGGYARASVPAAPAENAAAEDPYAKLGVETIVNAAGTYTFLTAAVMPPQVRRAVDRAAYHPVRLKDLQKASGEYLARKLHCEGALVSAGASAALTLATAACLAKANGVKPVQIPEDIAGKKNEVIVQKAHRYEYDHAMTLCNAVIREVVTMDDYRRAFNERTVMANFFNAAPDGEIQHKEWLAVAHEHGVPCHLDAAADVPPIENLWKYTNMGFDLVCFSGGKGICGPQNAGLLLGRKDLIELAAENNNPTGEAVGRGMKVAKEQIIGMVAAVDWLLEQTNEGLEAEFMRSTKVVQDRLRGVPTVNTHVVIPPVANHIPHLVIQYDPARIGATPHQIAETLRNSKPSIELNPGTGTIIPGLTTDENSIVIATWMLQPGEEHIVADRLHAALMHRQV